MAAAADVKRPVADPVRLEEIFERHHPMVLRTAFRVTGNAADAEDVLQTIFLRLVRREGWPVHVDTIESYLHRAAVNASLDLVRSRRRNQHVTLEDGSPRHAADSRERPDRTLAGKEIREWLRGAVARLSPAVAETFVLRFFEGKKNAEIATVLGTTPSTVAVTLHRARERLERAYRAEMGELS